MLISYEQRICRLLADARNTMEQYLVEDSGAISTKDPYINRITPESACHMAYLTALAGKETGDGELSAFAGHALAYAGRSLVESEGALYWPHPVPSLCSQGRWAREAIRAAELIGDAAAFRWLEELFSRWPYNEEEHKFVERFIGGCQFPTSVYGFLTTYNMIAEGVSDAWLVAEKTGNTALKERAKDCLVNFILPGQREDGIWNYHAPRGLGILNEGEEEYNYNLYLLNILSNLLELPEARELLAEPLKRSFDTLFRRFSFPDGSVYTPVHWGWDHIYESTLLSSLIAWRLYHYCGLPDSYRDITVRGIHWMELTDLGRGQLADGMSSVGLYWNTLYLDLCRDHYAGEAEVCTQEQARAQLRMVEQKLSVIPPDRAHADLYFGLRVFETRYAIQRKVQRMRKLSPHETASIPRKPSVCQLELPWEFSQTGYSGRVALSYDDQYLYLTAEVESAACNQPYQGSGLYQGDGILLELGQRGEAHAAVNLTVENGKPVAWKHNDLLPFGGDMRLYLDTIPRGWYLLDALLVRTTERGMEYQAQLAWKDLGVRPEQGKSMPAGVAICRATPYGVQYNQWGRTSLERNPEEYSGSFVFV